MRRSLRLLVALVLVNTVLVFSAQGQGAPQGSASALPSTPNGTKLEDGTPVKLRIGRTVSSEDAQVGDTVDFEVLEEVKVGDLVVIPKGGTAWATVTAAEAKRRMARGGKLDMNIDSVRLADGEKAALRAVKEVKGGGHTGAMTGGIVATAIVFWPAAPFFLFMHGKDITVPKGTEITAYVNGDFPLNLAKFQSNPAPVLSASPVESNTPTATVSSASATLDISSTPSGADIEIDGGFSGDTPSSVGVSPGDHVIRVTKKGYSPWERKIHLSTGNIRLVAELESGNPTGPTPKSELVPSPVPTAQTAAAVAPTTSLSSPAVPAVLTQAKVSGAAPQTGPTPTPAVAQGDGTVLINSDPPGAEIFVDSVGSGHAPLTLQLKPGKHRVQFVESGYKDSVTEVDVSSGTTVNVTRKLEK